MAEEAYNKIHGADSATFTFTTRRGRDAFVRRCEKFGARYDVRDHEINGKWDTAVITVPAEDLRPMRYLIKT